MRLRERLRGFLARDGRPPVVPAAPPPRSATPAPVPAPSPVTEVGDALVVDVRSPEAFAAGHLPGARNVALADVASVPRDRPIVVVCEDGVASSGVAERLVALGARAGWLAGGMRA
ncbi:MAG: rhodanese-like domain-containing protein [Myxococcota bacterium]